LVYHGQIGLVGLYRIINWLGMVMR
jgi:hypothetical protein